MTDKPITEDTPATFNADYKPTGPRDPVLLAYVRKILRGDQPLDEYIALMRKLQNIPSLEELRAMKARGELPPARPRKK